VIDKTNHRPSSLSSKDQLSNREPLLVQPKSDLQEIDSIISSPVPRKTSIENVLDVQDDTKAPKLSAGRRQNSLEKIEPRYKIGRAHV